MKTIKINVKYSESKDKHYYKEFRLVEEKDLPQIEKLEDLKRLKISGYIDSCEAYKDCEQPNDLAYEVDCFRYIYFDYEVYDEELDGLLDESEATHNAVESHWYAVEPNN